MRAKALAQEQARALRSQGYSLKSISLRLGVAKSSVSVWCKGIVLSPERIGELRSRLSAPKLGALANRLKRQQQVNYIRTEARKNFPKLSSEETIRLRDIGTAFYWAEGTKVGNSVDFTNSDPEMVKTAMAWLRIVCQVPENKFRLSVYYHANQDEDVIKDFWSKVTQVPLNQFTKSNLKKEGSGHRKNILYMGTCKVRVCDKDLLYRILTWIQQLHLS